MVQTKVVKNLKTHNVLCSVIFFSPENRAVHEIMWKHTVKPDRPQVTYKIWRMRFACWITKAVDTHSENVTCLLFPGKCACTDAPQCYVYSSLSVLLSCGIFLSLKHWRWLCPWNFRSTYYLLNAPAAPLKNCHLELILRLSLKNMTGTCDNTGTLVTRNIPREMPLLSNVAIFFSSVVVLTPNG
jgi:hypothetical protein